LNWTHQQLLFYADVNLLCKNINIIKRNTEALSDMSKGVGLETNVERTKYMFMSHH